MTNKLTDNTSDHDLLIRLDTKLERLSEDIKEMKNTQASRIGSVEQRITSLEDTIQNSSPKNSRTLTEANAAWIHDFKLTWKTMMTLASAIGAVVGFIISAIVQIFNLFGR